MINELRKALYKLDKAIYKLALLEEEELKDELGKLIAAMPASEEISKFHKMSSEINKRRALHENSEDLRKLEAERVDLLNIIPKIPELRTFKKLSEFMLERLTEAVLDTEDDGNKVGLIDAAMKEISTRSTVSNKPQVDSVDGVASLIADKTYGVTQEELQNKIREAADEIGNGLGIIIGDEN